MPTPRDGDIEDTKHALAVVLAGPAFLERLRAIDAEKGEGETPVPTVVIPGETTNPVGQGYPIAEVIGLRTDYATEDQQCKQALHQIAVHWTQVGDDELTITRDLQRLVRATRDLLWNSSLPALGNAPVLVTSEEYSELMPAKDRPFVKASQTLLRIATFTI